ncbi:hypothetical protein HCJ70_16165 [Listeria booriae]|uniref:hypothetical protein n=1 Tax=Listeria booriae TaxID=1552123 RepID=UPI00162543A6|nr:hypothetical protein [Listeria booriae]MBC2100587.1 hypothetical protein [Listeria booriae]
MLKQTKSLQNQVFKAMKKDIAKHSEFEDKNQRFSSTIKKDLAHSLGAFEENEVRHKKNFRFTHNK